MKTTTLMLRRSTTKWLAIGQRRLCVSSITATHAHTPQSSANTRDDVQPSCVASGFSRT